jgi:hypothetical protein
MPAWELSWRVVGGPGTVPVRLPRSPAARRALRLRVLELPAATPVAIMDAGPGAARRSRRFARLCGVRLEREYAALPSLRFPAYLVERSPETVRYFCSALLAAPPRARPAAAAGTGMARWAIEHMPPGLVARFAPARVGVGQRT